MNLNNIALDIRRRIFKTVCETKAGHLASSLSSVEIMVSLYFDNILNYNEKDPDWNERDRFILSKGHSALCLYTTLAKAGYFNEKELETFCSLGTKFGGLPIKGKVPGVEATTGSLGHGLSFAAGIALSGKLKRKDYKVYALLGDGEIQEGEIWEAALFISHNKLNNLITIIDYNKIQATGLVSNIIEIESLSKKWEAFGFDVLEVDGHDIHLLKKALINHNSTNENNKPIIIIAHTIKGKGVSYIENKEDWHYKIPKDREIEIGISDLHLTREEYGRL